MNKPNPQQLLVELSKLRYGMLLPEQAWETFPEEASIMAMQASGEFDEATYLQDYPDVASSGMNAIEHFVRHGIFENRILKRKDPESGYLPFKTGEVTQLSDKVQASGQVCQNETKGNPFKINVF